MTHRSHTEHDADDARALRELERVIASHGPMTVAFSGGVDSALLAFVARRVLGDDMTCAIGFSPSLAAMEAEDALGFLRTHGIPYTVVVTHEMDDPRYRANAPDRCFFCKDELFRRIVAEPACRRFPLIAYGANRDDAFDHRPGAAAAASHGVVAPLAEAGLGKEVIRRLARTLGLEVWDKPAAPCLASRIPYESEVNEEKLRQVERAEAAVKARGFRVCRVRHFGDRARVELPAEDHQRARDVWGYIEREILDAGFSAVELDRDGFRSGRLNDAVDARRRV